MRRWSNVFKFSNRIITETIVVTISVELYVCVFVWRYRVCPFAMDDDSDAGAICLHSCASTGKQGEYHLPQNGVCWIWSWTKGVYHGLTVRDLAADRDLCSVVFLREIRAASKVTGRRSNTLLPDEDRFVLRSECVDGNLPLDIVSGTVLDRDPVLPSHVTLRDVEGLLQCSCPWSVQTSHRLHIPTSSSTKLGDKRPAKSNSSSSVVAVPAASVSSGHGDTSKITMLVQYIRHVLIQLNQTQALESLDQLTDFLRVFGLNHMMFLSF